MNEYKSKFGSVIYSYDHEKAVRNSKETILDLINWLEWEWNDTYLNPHLNERTVSTASMIEVRSPINTKSIGGWKNYKEIMSAAVKSLNM